MTVLFLVHWKLFSKHLFKISRSYISSTILQYTFPQTFPFIKGGLKVSEINTLKIFPRLIDTLFTGRHIRNNNKKNVDELNTIKNYSFKKTVSTCLRSKVSRVSRFQRSFYRSPKHTRIWSIPAPEVMNKAGQKLSCKKPEKWCTFRKFDNLSWLLMSLRHLCNRSSNGARLDGSALAFVSSSLYMRNLANPSTMKRAYAISEGVRPGFFRRCRNNFCRLPSYVWVPSLNPQLALEMVSFFTPTSLDFASCYLSDLNSFRLRLFLIELSRARWDDCASSLKDYRLEKSSSLFLNYLSDSGNVTIEDIFGKCSQSFAKNTQFEDFFTLNFSPLLHSTRISVFQHSSEECIIFNWFES